jgi:hypothetical protein
MKKIILIIACLIISFFIDAQTPPPCYTAITSASMAIVAQGASSIVSGDFNSDGIADMATCGKRKWYFCCTTKLYHDWHW